MHAATRIAVFIVVLTFGLSVIPVKADVVAVVSAKSTVTTLTRVQVTDIFLGKVSRFPNGDQAIPIDQAEGSSVRDEFYAKFFGRSAAQIKAFWSKIIFTGRGQPPRVVANSIEMKKRIAENPAAIGYIDARLLDDTVRVVL
jgi:ABC-type phosphate transport system substrate-binding protein